MNTRNEQKPRNVSGDYICELLVLLSISFPEPTCLLVSTKTRSSGIINKQHMGILSAHARDEWNI